VLGRVGRELGGVGRGGRGVRRGSVRVPGRGPGRVVRTLAATERSAGGAGMTLRIRGVILAGLVCDSRGGNRLQETLLLTLFRAFLNFSQRIARGGNRH